MTPLKPELSSGEPRLSPRDDVERIAGIGPKTAAALAQVGVRTVADLLFHLPRRYEDRGRVVTVADAADRTGPVLLRGRLSADRGRYVRRRLHIADGEFVDDTRKIAVRWFNQPWVVERFADGVEAFVFGSVSTTKSGKMQLTNPEVGTAKDSSEIEELVPIYGRLGPLTGKRLRNALNLALSCLGDLVDPIPEIICRQCGLVSLSEALNHLHRPPVPGKDHERERAVDALNTMSTAAHLRLAFDELLAVSSVVAGYRSRRLEQKAIPVSVGPEFVRRARTVLPFDLTASQNRVVGEITADLGRPMPMARLLQGDVGSGKTAVAVLAILAVLTDGRQAALMAPTELLAEQLHRSVAAALAPEGFEVRLLTGSLNANERRLILDGLARGDIDAVVGTHALFQEGVDYRDLGLVVIDEQHRFGVAQRQRLLDKGDSPHLLVMTATPIPRSLALTLYGDLELSIIDELPPGRSPVRTEIRDGEARQRILRFLRSEIDDGGQGFLVYPLIDTSEKLTAAAIEEHEGVVRAALGDLEIGVLHGRLDREQREDVAERFRSGELKVILATTVIEVGVDVPAASVMIIESADRFGLSQLHQLRGRVGRGARKSWCILITGEDPSESAVRRLGVLESTTDGFAIAEADLKHRGPGELTGQRQWGALGLRFADLVRHQDLVDLTRSVARDLANDGRLSDVRDALLIYHPVGVEFSIG